MIPNPSIVFAEDDLGYIEDEEYADDTANTDSGSQGGGSENVQIVEVPVEEEDEFIDGQTEFEDPLAETNDGDQLVVNSYQEYLKLKGKTLEGVMDGGDKVDPYKWADKGFGKLMDWVSDGSKDCRECCCRCS